MSRSTRAAAVFAIEAALDRYVGAAYGRPRIPLPAKWAHHKTAAYYEKNERKLRDRGWQRNPWVRA
ncbi:MAG: hypothetical protein MN733_20195 [Nitrososphaera sp.]|nr:hypothetical protein [Nitrososphaera sp.]